ncbi:hypothetical protein ACFQV2_27900 [Actinokineospora soli]|uniref:Uncharacterized protein n=1 Tax=Actinokineospora soli TaxID=1048753 RepID=A0ABW2TUU0_9PSEU
MKRPLEIRVAMVVFALGAVLFVGAGALRDAGSLTLPVIAAVFGLLACAGLWVRWHLGGTAAFVAAGLIALVHTLIALDPEHWAFRVLSGVLAAAHVYAAVLVLTKPARAYLQGSAA